VAIVYRRPPDDVQHFSQELLHDGAACKISLLVLEPHAAPLPIGEIDVPPGGAIMWFMFPGRPYEVGAVYDQRGYFLGYYTNFVQPPRPETAVWHLTDLFLDVWQTPDSPPQLLDEDELTAAAERGWVGSEDVARTRAEAAAVLRAARADRWPPGVVARNPLDAVPSLRFRRDAPGTFFANLIIGRLIAFGIYALGAISVTSLAFSAFTSALQPGAGLTAGRMAWLGLIAVELVLLLGFALAGKLPATGRPRPEEALTERLLFFGTLVSGAAVMLYPDSRLWQGALTGLYATLAVFLSIFAVSRARFDHRFPALAVTGLAVCAVALLVLLL
jgi:predicted RNA-binding protein associated with RNAse of E/G family